MDETTVKKIREVVGEFDADDDFLTKFVGRARLFTRVAGSTMGDPILPGEDSRKDDIF